MNYKRIEMLALEKFPIITENDNLCEIIDKSLEMNEIVINDNDIIVIAQKIVSISENRIVKLNTITCSTEAYDLAEKTGRSPELCQVILEESSEVLSIVGKNIITKHRLGFVCTSAGIDSSNVASKKANLVTLLPENPDKSAEEIKSYFFRKYNKKIAVIINDSFGRESRHGSVGVAIGVSGIDAIEVREGVDLYGNSTRPQIALIDEISSAASILMGQQNEQIPVVVVKGVKYYDTGEDRIAKILK